VEANSEMNRQRIARELMRAARELVALPDDDTHRLRAIERRLRAIASGIGKSKRELETEEGYLYDIMARQEVGSESNLRASSMWKAVQSAQQDLERADLSLGLKRR